MAGISRFHFTRKIFLLTALSVAGGVLTGTAAMAQTGGDARRGLSLAESWCASCHVVDRKAPVQKVNSAPPFTRIASDPGKTSEYLRRWLTTTHPQMPNFNMGRQEIEDLIAYLQSLSASN